jgi:hypothetical protein
MLVKCSKTILHDIGMTNIISNPHPIKPALPAFLARMASKLSPFAALSNEGPYHVPYAMDFGAALTLLEAK